MKSFSICAEIFTGLLVCQSYTKSHSHCDFMCAIAQPCWANIISEITQSTESKELGEMTCPVVPAVQKVEVIVTLELSVESGWVI